ncbi:MAG: 3-phosphoshikimate 1-carboxyvinyltransferase, partial [Candidatus Gastranaerophilales bacterium]|nr:3-phosphoshikimate 1-carboxyvinyltransferase [Candidatus Gastranaerophilales bacterium]
MTDVKTKYLLAPLKGVIDIPPDKSISHRAIMLGSLTKGKIRINNFSACADCISTLNIFKNLGVEAKYIDEKNIILNSAKGFFPPPVPLNCGNSGTSMRLLTGLFSGQNFNTELFGDESLSKRPMMRIIEPLSQMGAKISSNEGKSPLKITGSKLSGINYTTKIPSAQVKSSLLLAGLYAEGETVINETFLSRNHTELMLKYFEADIETGKNNAGFYSKIKKSAFKPKDIYVSGDISSAAFFMTAAAIVKDSDIIIKDVGLNPTRTGILDVMLEMGANIQILDERVKNGEKIGDIRVLYSPDLKGINIEGEIIPRLIDEIPVICVLASHAKGTTVIKNAGDLKNKESDRITRTALGLSKMGADITPLDDGFIINGFKKHFNIKPIELETFHDHRLAMSFYVMGLTLNSEFLIKDFEWLNTSFPEFLRLFAKIGV